MGKFSDGKVKGLFLKALEKDPSDWASWLQEACPDPELRREVSTLLRAHERAEGFLEQPGADDSGAAEGPGSVIDRYKILQEIGEGGFGVVYMAEQTEPVRRKVALKIIKLGMDTKQVVARFEAERQALALMDHPNIAKVLDGGATDKGRPYFVMELVKGVPVTEYCDKAGLDTAERLALFQDVCHAVQHAHQKGIIHRDLKPSNVLVTLHDGKPVPKVIDFGIAKATDRRLTEKTLFTEFQQIIGTPEYMAPEQAEMTSLDVDTRADIYSLGVLLYELLTGTKPFDMKSLLEKGYGEILRTIREVEPPRPSTRLSTMGDQLPGIAKQRHTEPKLLGKIIRGDLDWIVMKALEKDRSRRYDTATAFADDIARYLTDLPVLASPPSRAYRLRKYLKRHRVAVGAAAAVLLALVAGLVVAVAAMGEARQKARAARAAEAEASARRDEANAARALESEQRARAEKGEAEAKREAERASTALELVQRALSSADPHETKDPGYTVRQLLTDIADGIGDRLADQPEIEATVRRTIGIAYLGLGLAREAEPHLNLALDLRRRLLGEEDEATRESISDWEVLLHDKGHFREAEALAREILEDRRRRLGAEHPGALKASVVLAERLAHLARYAEAEEILRGARETCRERFGDDPAFATGVCIQLAKVLTPRARHTEAENLARAALAETRRYLGDDHPDVAARRLDLGEVLQAEGRYAEAEALGREALALRRRSLGDRHLETANAKAWLADVLRSRGSFEEAEQCYKEALAVIRDARPEHPSTAAYLHNLGELHRARGDLATAEPLFREALAITGKVQGEDHPSYGACLASVGVLLRGRGQFDRAGELFRRAGSIVERSLGRDHPTFAKILGNRGSLAWRLGHYDEAEKNDREALAIFLRIFGEDHPSTAQALGNLGTVLMDRGKLADAEPLLVRAVEITRRTRPDHPELGIALNDLGELLRRAGRYAEAEEALTESLALLRERLGPRHADAAGALHNLGNVQRETGRLDEARESFEFALAIMREAQGPGHQLEGMTLCNLAQCEGLCGRPEVAERLLREAIGSSSGNSAMSIPRSGRL